MGGRIARGGRARCCVRHAPRDPASRLCHGPARGAAGVRGAAGGGGEAGGVTVSRTELSLAAAGLAGFGMAGLGDDYGPRWLIGTSLLLAGVSLFWLYGIAQQNAGAG